jgi:hypothetical protein
MKNFIAIIFCGAAALLMHACRNNPDFEKMAEKKFKPGQALQTITMGEAKDWIVRYDTTDSIKPDKSNAFIDAFSDYSIMKDIFLNPNSTGYGIFLKKGLDANGAVHWLAWEAEPDSVAKRDASPVYVMQTVSCICMPCCTPPNPKDTIH